MKTGVNHSHPAHAHDDQRTAAEIEVMPRPMNRVACEAWRKNGPNGILLGDAQTVKALAAIQSQTTPITETRIDAILNGVWP